jgi:hypothetical protein
MKKNVPTSETGDDRDHRRPPGLQEHDDYQHHQHHRDEDGYFDFIHRLLNECGRVVDDGVLDPRGKARSERLHR